MGQQRLTHIARISWTLLFIAPQESSNEINENHLSYCIYYMYNHHYTNIDTSIWVYVREREEKWKAQHFFFEEKVIVGVWWKFT